MSSIKIKDLPEKIDDLKDEDIVVIEDNEDTKKISLLKLKAAFSMDNKLSAIKDSLLEKINDFINSNNNNYNELKEKNEQLEIICNNLRNDHDHDAQRIFELEDKLITQVDLVSDLITKKTQLEKMVDDLTIDKDKLTADIDKLTALVASKESDLNNLAVIYNQLNTRYNELLSESNELKNTVNQLKEKSNTDIDDFIDSTNKELSNKVEELMMYIKHYHPDDILMRCKL